MINELSDLGKMLRSQKAEREWVHDALKEENVSIDIVIAGDGGFIKFEQFDRKPTIAEAITAKKGKARLLLDKAEEVLGYGGALSLKKHAMFLEKIAEYRELTEQTPDLDFYEKNKQNGIENALNA
jgi:CRISPR-associated protein Csd1